MIDMLRHKLLLFLGLPIILLAVFFYFPSAVKGKGEDISTLYLSTETIYFTATPLPSEAVPLSPARPSLETDTPTPTVTGVRGIGSPPIVPPLNEVLQPRDFISDQVLVKFDPTLSNQLHSEYLQANDASLISKIPDLGVSVLRVPVGQAEAVATELNASPGVIYAEPNYPAYALDVIPNDPGWSNQYNMVAIDAPQGWSLTTGASSVTIAIVDTGVDLSHPDLVNKILPGYDFVNNDVVAQDDNGHGTHVSAIAAAETNNGIGVAGVDWGANILPVKVLDASGNGTYANVAAGITWATDQGAQVINLSLGGTSKSSTLEDAVNYADAHGVILVAAAGNSGGSVLYPAAYPPVMAVAATDSSNTRASFSSYGSTVDVAAPGVNIYSALVGGNYGFLSGTSMAAPHVTGLAAILLGIPGIDPAHVRSLIESTSLDLGTPGRDVYYGYGLIQMDAAIKAALPTTTFTISGNAGVGGAILSYTDGSLKTATTDDNGYYSFVISYSWSGTVTPSLSGYSFSPDTREYTDIQANQIGQDYTALQTYILDVNIAGTGHGIITSDPAGIDCGEICSYPFGDKDSVTLSAVASIGSTFTGWSGSDCSGTGTCTVTTDSAKSVTAIFTLNTYNLSISIDGNGSGTVTSSPAGIDCGSTCSYAFAYNTTVTLMNMPIAPTTFGGWSGEGCSGIGTCIVTMDAVKSVTATFTLYSFRLFLPLVILP